MIEVGGVDRRQFERTPEFYAEIERESVAAASQLTSLLTRGELAEYVQTLVSLNKLLRIQLAEQSAALTVVCLGTKEQWAGRQNRDQAPMPMNTATQA